MKKARRKFYIRAAVAVLLAWVALSASAFVVMRQPIDALCRVMARTPGIVLALIPFRSMWTVARDGDVRPGDPAPDFELPREDGGADVRLSAFRGKKPVVLVFGSYT